MVDDVEVVLVTDEEVDVVTEMVEDVVVTVEEVEVVCVNCADHKRLCNSRCFRFGYTMLYHWSLLQQEVSHLTAFPLYTSPGTAALTKSNTALTRMPLGKRKAL